MRWNLRVCSAVLLSGLTLGECQTYLKPVTRGGTSGKELSEPPAEGQFFLEIQAPANQRKDEVLNDSAYPGDDLSELATGEFKTEKGVRFQIGKQLMALKGKLAAERPERIRVTVDRRASALYFLHACGWGSFGGPESDHFEKEGTLIGYYRVNYEDGDYEVIPIVYGKDVRDWWGIWDKFAGTRNSEVVWRGTNKHLRGRREAANEPKPLRLFQTSWSNPWPELRIVSIDYVSTGGTAAPFCVSISGYLSRDADPRVNPHLGVAEVEEKLKSLSRAGEEGYRAIYSAAPNGGEVKFVFSAPGMISTATPDLSHDGRMLLCDAVSKVDGIVESRIFMTALEGPFRNVVRDLGYGNTPVWSPDDQRIAFMLNSGNPLAVASGVWVMNGDGSERKHLGEGIYPQWSPDGQKLCVDTGGNLAIHDLKTDERETVLEEPLRSGFGGATWSADGSKLTFILIRDGIEEIALIDPKQGIDSLTTLYKEENAQRKLVGPPSLSPDGKQVAFAIQDLAGEGSGERQWLNTRIEILEIDPLGKPRHLEEKQIGKINRGMRWTRDGSRILFSSER